MILVDKKQIKKPKKILWLIFLLGFSIMMYPLISRTYYDYRGNEEVSHFQSGLKETPSAELQKKLQMAYAYNNALLSGEETPLGDPFNEEGKEAAIVYLVLGASPEESGAARWAVTEPNLMNVAATRAKKEFYVIGDRELYQSLKLEVVSKTLEVIDVAE